MPPSVVPRFFLYGEPPRAPEDRFLHLEEIDDRARPAAWRIQPHAHADLHQVFAIRSGGGTLGRESEWIGFAAPAVLTVPAGTVHGFQFEAGTAGKVLTLSDALLREIVRLDASFAAIFETARCLQPAEGADLAERLDRLAGELAEGAAPARRGALVAHATLALVGLARMASSTAAPPEAQDGAHAQIVARFRALAEERFHLQADLDTYCRGLGITIGRLRLACRTVAETTPGRILGERVMLEARRALTYSERPVSEIAYGLGFADPAYFSRFFARSAGCSPSAFRRRSRAATAPASVLKPPS